jgi:1-acyl-sn-glycerol-3-phosphate acyltransferase
VLKWYWGRAVPAASLPKGPCIVVANHNSHLDAPLPDDDVPDVGASRSIHPVAAADYFGKTAWRRTIVMIGMKRDRDRAHRGARAGRPPARRSTRWRRRRR